MVKGNLHTIVLALLSAAFSFGSFELAAYDDCCDDTCWSNCNWACWVGGALLGAATGAGTGYAAGHNRGKNGRQGPPGPIGPTGPAGAGFTLNTTDSLTVTLDRTAINDPALEFEFQVVDPTGEILATQIFTGASLIPDILVDIPAATPKPEGNYLVRWRVIDLTLLSINTTLGIAGIVIDGFPPVEIPTEMKFWLINEFAVNYFTFP